ncbi:TetR/AcrR family transcriptional regulator [Actinomadura madurae]|uniref:DNA-binding transcriptional regulator, AcrR family n=1 Tax=Actinomadura madurae TaxID=1993 RepID=A0A1I5I546_9ACTN|nr:TetR/AcrR family transcriptional regulator [Actinomadura madurae]SFO55236.1 DNA-binding transcriptional regulator, AcrR family [Actinomadura madurae]SPT57449.1 transcriptional repressor BetI [Actinomadura madurae]
MRQLPVVGSPPAERADAALNRRRILRAAARLIEARGPEAVSMDEVAREAGVGVGTVYRRFGDRARLVYAVIDDRERDFQTAFLHGPPPLGPGAAPADRLRAFLHALADRTDAQADLLAMAESDPPDARFRDGSYALYHMHLAMLIGRIRPAADAAYLADALLAPLAANLFLYQRRTRGMPLDRVKAGLDALATGLLTPDDS